jgi:hypothetical protein
MSEKENKNHSVSSFIASLTAAAFNFGIIAAEYNEDDVEYIKAKKLVHLEQEALLIRIKLDS